MKKTVKIIHEVREVNAGDLKQQIWDENPNTRDHVINWKLASALAKQGIGEYEIGPISVSGRSAHCAGRLCVRPVIDAWIAGRKGKRTSLKTWYMWPEAPNLELAKQYADCIVSRHLFPYYIDNGYQCYDAQNGNWYGHQSFYLRLNPDDWLTYQIMKN